MTATLMIAVAVLSFILVAIILYIFYPALAIAKYKSKVTEEVLSKDQYSDEDVVLSIVIPAYNEEDRLPVMLDSALDSIQEHDSTLIQLAQQKNKSKRTRMEWIVVSDGSTDKTADVVKRYAATTKARHTWKLVTLHTNSGKGAAVQAGMLHASRQSLKLMVDADGATDFGALLTLLEKSHPVVFGSRAHLESQVKRSFVRNLLMHAFHICVDLLVGSTIRDTQCGFKLFEADAAHILFNTQHLRRWAFDIELVVLCAQLGLEICEVGVPWHEVEGSKLDSTKLQLALVAIGMLRDMLCVRLCYSVGLWRVKAEKVHK